MLDALVIAICFMVVVAAFRRDWNRYWAGRAVAAQHVVHVPVIEPAFQWPARPRFEARTQFYADRWAA